MIIPVLLALSFFTSVSPFDLLQYPGATVLAGAETVTTAPTASSGLEHAIFATPDPVEAVLSFYEKAFGEKLRANCVHGPDAEGRITASSNDSVQDRQGQSARPVEVRVLTRAERDGLVSITITKAQGEDLTHIVVCSRAGLIAEIS